MKDNIDSRHIGNRKVIIELIYNPQLSLLDKQGELVNKIEHLNIFPIIQWKIGYGRIFVRDESEDNFLNAFQITIHKLTFVSYKVDSIDSYANLFKKVYHLVKETLGDLEVKKISCRIIGSYLVSSNDYNSVLKNFQGVMSSTLLDDRYPIEDFVFKLVYDHGMYQIGPLNIDDEFFDKEFKNNKKPHIGIMIDTDNYTMIDSSNNILLDINNILELSLSIEKDLYLKLNTL